MLNTFGAGGRYIRISKSHIKPTLIHIFTPLCNSVTHQAVGLESYSKTKMSLDPHMIFSPKLCFFSRNVSTRNVRKLIKGSQDSDYGLDSNKNLSQKWALAVGAQGTMVSAKNV